MKSGSVQITVNKSGERSHAQQETATNCGVVGLQAIVSTVGLFRKQLHCVESRTEYYWKLRSKNGQNIEALMCPLCQVAEDV